MNARDPITGQLDGYFEGVINNFFALSAFFLGLPYLLWITWRRGEELIGKEEDFAEIEPTFPKLKRYAGPNAVRTGLMISVFFSCCFCFTMMFVIQAIIDLR